MAGRTLAGSLALKGDWALGEDNWKDEMDTNLLWLSVVVQGRAIDQVLAEPGSPVEGDVYILAAAHATHPNAIAAYDEAGWHYKVPLSGWRFYNVTLGVFQQFNGTTWSVDTTGLTAEDVRDIMGAALVSGSNVTVVPNDGSDTITINATGGGGGGPTDEQIQDMIATFFAAGSNVTLTYNDVANTFTVAATAGSGGPVVISTIVTAGLQTDITFSAIPGTYKKLGFRFIGRPNTASQISLRLNVNGDTGNNYIWGRDGADFNAGGSTNFAGGSGALAYAEVGYIEGSGACLVEISIPFYAITTWPKFGYGKNVNANNSFQGYQMDQVFRWNNNAAITGIVLTLAGGVAFANGCICELIGYPA